MPLAEEASPIEKALYKIVGAPSAGGTDDSGSFQFAPKSSYTSGLFEGRGGTTDASSGQAAGPAAYTAPAAGAQTAFQAGNTVAPAGAATQAAVPAAAAPVAAAPVYNLYNQTRYGFGGTPQNQLLEVGTTGGKYIPVTNLNAYDP